MSNHSWRSWAGWRYALACAPLLVLLVVALVGFNCEVQMVRTATLQSALGEVRIGAIRRAAKLETLLQRRASGRGWTDRDWREQRRQPALQALWAELPRPDSRRLYAAIVDSGGTIVMHTTPSLIDKPLEQRWYVQEVAEAGPDVVRLDAGPLAGESAAYDVSVPLLLSGEPAGEYHEGLSARWLNAEIARRQRGVLLFWLTAMALSLAAAGALAWALRSLARRYRELARRLERGAFERARELAQIGSGLAHEVRNPLHAVRINLHTLRRSLNGRSQLSPDQLAASIQESDAEIDRLDGLMHDLVHFAVPGAGEKIAVDVTREAQATLNLLNEELRRKQIDVQTRWAQVPATVAIDPSRLRQMLVNLLTFAQNNAGEKGQIEVEVADRGSRLELAVADSGPSLTDLQRASVFEPFQAPAETGSGLGLALVQSFVEEAGGTVGCERRAPSGNRFWVVLPTVQSAH
ncbi:MAG: HAMP domain-containing sensor histidine kinase [Pirellulaceae bacterium]